MRLSTLKTVEKRRSMVWFDLFDLYHASSQKGSGRLNAEGKIWSWNELRTIICSLVYIYGHFCPKIKLLKTDITGILIPLRLAKMCNNLEKRENCHLKGFFINCWWVNLVAKNYWKWFLGRRRQDNYLGLIEVSSLSGKLLVDPNHLARCHENWEVILCLNT